MTLRTDLEAIVRDDGMFWDILATTPSEIEAWQLIEDAKTALLREKNAENPRFTTLEINDALALLKQKRKAMRESDYTKRVFAGVEELFGRDALRQLKGYMVDTDPFMDQAEKNYHRERIKP